MTESDTSVGTADESVTNQPIQESQRSIEDLVTETRIHEKEFSVSIDQDTENPLHYVRQSDEDLTLSSVADALEDIKEWVNEVNDEEWELDQFTLATTIVVKRTETEENGPENSSVPE